MRKQIIDQAPQKESPAKQGWLDQKLAQIEFTSEDEAHPIESAVTTYDETGWRAAQPGKQTIRILFDEPQTINRIQLLFNEKERERAQEFLLRWQSADDSTYREVVRQQFNFSPPHTVEESEDFNVELNAVSVLELHIIPDVSGGDAYASLAQLRLA